MKSTKNSNKLPKELSVGKQVWHIHYRQGVPFLTKSFIDYVHQGDVGVRAPGCELWFSPHEIKLTKTEAEKFHKKYLKEWVKFTRLEVAALQKRLAIGEELLKNLSKSHKPRLTKKSKKVK